MKNIEEFINRLNFKVATKIYLIISVVMLAICGVSIAYVTKDKIYMAVDYEKASEMFKKQGVNNNLNFQLNKLASDSKDIVNAIVLDRNSNVISKVNNTIIGNNTKFLLTPYEDNKKYLQDNINSNVLYRVVKEEDILLNKDYIKNNEKVTMDIDEEFSYELDFSNRNIYLVNYMVNKNTGDKIFIIRTANPIPYAERLLEITGGILVLILAIYWIGLALWVYKDASKKRNNPPLWGLLVLVTNLAGLIIYTIFKQSSRICLKCGVMQSKENIFCNNCGTKINEDCSKCGNIVNKGENYCTKCGNKL